MYMASKRNPARRKTKRKATFIPKRVEAAMRSAFETPNSYIMNRVGIIGYDIGYLDGKTYMVEANYSPRFDRATIKLGTNIADQVVKHIIDETL